MNRTLLAAPVLFLVAAACSVESGPEPVYDVNTYPIAGGQTDSTSTNVLGMFSLSFKLGATQ